MSLATSKLRLNNVFKQLMSLHWWMAICYLLLFPSGIIMAKFGNKINDRELLFAAHKSFGVLVLLLLGWRVYLLVRVWGKKYSKHLPKLTTNWYFKTGLHTLLYFLMFVVPLSGYWLSNAYQANNISLFGVPMPDLFPVSSDAADRANFAHSTTSKALAIFILIHSIAQRKVINANWRRLSDWIMKLKVQK
jgi:cytochrome b561